MNKIKNFLLLILAFISVPFCCIYLIFKKDKIVRKFKVCDKKNKFYSDEVSVLCDLKFICFIKYKDGKKCWIKRKNISTCLACLDSKNKQSICAGCWK